MKRALLWAAGIGLIIASPGFNAAAYAKSSSDEEAIRALEQNFRDAFRVRDVEKIMANYERSEKLIVFDVVPPRQHVGWDAYKKAWQDFLSTLEDPISFDINDLNITVSGDLAYSYSSQHTSGQMNNGSPVDRTVRVTDVYRKIGGRWLIVHEHVSVPVDLKTEKPDIHSKP
jgi:ketosteroid isomerase-like protein